VGIEGKGESVWLGFFLYEVLRCFAPLAREHSDAAFAERCEREAATLRANIDTHAWDGAWYRRAWFDDGTPLGSSSNAECSIDSIAQSWSVLSSAGDSHRANIAMDSMDKRLVRREQGLIQLLDPPFDMSPMDPGYIKGYVPGVRENGGQYTHAAVWAAMAFAELGDSRRAWELAALINPVNHARSASAVDIYKTEPYVMAADVYAIAPHTGRGGWSWYTGAAGWMYRLIVESLLGVRREGNRLRIVPCMHEQWNGYTLKYRYGAARYCIDVHCTLVADAAGSTTTLDGVVQGEEGFDLIDDGSEHRVVVRINRMAQPDQQAAERRQTFQPQHDDREISSTHGHDPEPAANRSC
jgi:cyclic beta-1,2-glucan synthetase